MADEAFPKLPAKWWWLLRDHFHKKVPSRVTKSYLANVLHVSDASAGNALPELRRMGLVDENDVPTTLANRFRFDDEYAEVCKEIREAIYPDELLDAMPEFTGDLTPAVRWFQRRANVGEGTARKMSGIFGVLMAADPSQRPEELTAGKTAASGRVSKAKKTEPRPTAAKPQESAPPPAVPPSAVSDPAGFSLHIDLQVHISPDATPEQIETIFKSIRKHLYSDRAQP